MPSRASGVFALPQACGRRVRGPGDRASPLRHPRGRVAGLQCPPTGTWCHSVLPRGSHPGLQEEGADTQGWSCLQESSWRSISSWLECSSRWPRVSPGERGCLGRGALAAALCLPPGLQSSHPEQRAAGQGPPPSPELIGHSPSPFCLGEQAGLGPEWLPGGWDRGLTGTPGQEQVQATLSGGLAYRPDPGRPPFCVLFSAFPVLVLLLPCFKYEDVEAGGGDLPAGSGAGDTLCCLLKQEHLCTEQAGARLVLVPPSLREGGHGGPDTLTMLWGT